MPPPILNHIPDVIEADHRRYGEQRWALLTEDDRAWCERKGYDAVLRDTGVGGIRDAGAVRCLHVHLAHALATGGGNLVGRWVLEALSRGEDGRAAEYQRDAFRGRWEAQPSVERCVPGQLPPEAEP